MLWVFIGVPIYFQAMGRAIGLGTHFDPRFICAVNMMIILCHKISQEKGTKYLRNRKIKVEETCYSQAQKRFQKCIKCIDNYLGESYFFLSYDYCTLVLLAIKRNLHKNEGQVTNHTQYLKKKRFPEKNDCHPTQKNTEKSWDKNRKSPSQGQNWYKTKLKTYCRFDVWVMPYSIIPLMQSVANIKGTCNKMIANTLYTLYIEVWISCGAKYITCIKLLGQTFCLRMHSVPR